MTSASPGNEFQMGYALRNYQQILQDYAFDNFWNILFRVSVDPYMGDYLDMVNNAKADPVAKTQPNENYAREIMQLFSIGLWELNQDGTLVLDALGNPIPTYSQTDITEMANVMTGWTYWPVSGPTQVEVADQLPVQHDALRGRDAAGGRRRVRHDELARHQHQERGLRGRRTTARWASPPARPPTTTCAPR